MLMAEDDLNMVLDGIFNIEEEDARLEKKVVEEERRLKNILDKDMDARILQYIIIRKNCILFLTKGDRAAIEMLKPIPVEEISIVFLALANLGKEYLYAGSPIELINEELAKQII